MNSLTIRPLAETADSVTLSRDDFEALTDQVADAAGVSPSYLSEIETGD